MKTPLENNIKYSRILITGASGLIGSEILNKLPESCSIFIADRNIKEEKIVKNLTYLPFDLATGQTFNNFPKDIECVLHLAQSEKFRDFPGSALEVFNVNTYSTLLLLDYAKKAGVKKFIYASSGGVYGNSDSGFLEDHPITNNTSLGFYLGTKLCSEILVSSYTMFFDVNILRYFFVYGAKQNKTMLIPRLVHSIKNKKAITLQGQDGIRINPIHVTDAAKATINAIYTEGSHNYNISGNEILSLRDLCNIISEKIDTDPIFEIEQKEPKNLIGDNEKMKNILMVPKINFNEGIIDVIKQFKN